MTKKWQKISEKTIFDSGYRKLVRKEFKLPNGQTADFDIKLEENVASIMTLTTDKKVVLVKQFRPGPGKILMELPGGDIEKNQTALQTAKKELLEETGYTGKLIKIGQSYECAYSTKIKHHYLALNCLKVAEQKLDESEFAEVIILDWTAFLKHLKTGNLTDSDTAYMAIHYLNQKKWKI